MGQIVACTGAMQWRHAQDSPQAPVLLCPCNDASLVGEPHSSGTRAEAFYERLAGRLRPALEADPALRYSAGNCVGLVPKTSISAYHYYCRSFGINRRRVPSGHTEGHTDTNA